MGWIEKGTTAPFENQPISGLFFFDGDILAERFGSSWAKGQKYPMIEFQSGDQYELWNSRDPKNAIVHVFGEMDVRLFDTRDEAMPHAERVAEECGYFVRPHGEQGIEVSGGSDGEHVIIFYDASERRIIDIQDVHLIERQSHTVELLDKKLRDALPPLFAGEDLGLESLALVKFFTPDAGWTWYASEFDGIDTFFGLVSGDDVELGYFSLSELEGARGTKGLPIERDRHYEPKTLSELQAHHKSRRGE